MCIDQKTKCDDCGKDTDGLMTCYLVDGQEERLCPDCIKESGFCLRCGNFCAGMSSFDFSDMPGYCSDCAEEIKYEFGENEEEDDEELGGVWDTDPFDTVEEVQTCRQCGCSENDPCVHPQFGPCWWAEDDLCSHCQNWPGESTRPNSLII